MTHDVITTIEGLYSYSNVISISRKFNILFWKCPSMRLSDFHYCSPSILAVHSSLEVRRVYSSLYQLIPQSQRNHTHWESPFSREIPFSDQEISVVVTAVVAHLVEAAHRTVAVHTPVGAVAAAVVAEDTSQILRRQNFVAPMDQEVDRMHHQIQVGQTRLDQASFPFQTSFRGSWGNLTSWLAFQEACLSSSMSLDPVYAMGILQT